MFSTNGYGLVWMDSSYYCRISVRIFLRSSLSLFRRWFLKFYPIRRNLCQSLYIIRFFYFRHDVFVVLCIFQMWVSFLRLISFILDIPIILCLENSWHICVASTKCTKPNKYNGWNFKIAKNYNYLQTISSYGIRHCFQFTCGSRRWNTKI